MVLATGPTSLVTGAQASTVVAVEILIEEDVIPPVGIALELLGTTVDGPSTVLVASEDPGESVGDLLAHIEQIHHLP